MHQGAIKVVLISEIQPYGRNLFHIVTTQAR
jgi:hypothetical protein